MAVAEPTTRRRTLGKRVCDWIEAYCVIPDGPLIGQPFVVHPFWRQIIFEWYELVPDATQPDGWRRRYSQGLIGVAKKNLKTSHAAAMALWELAGSEDPGALVLCAAASEEQSANLLYGSARSMVDNSPPLQQALSAMEKEISVVGQPRARMRNLTSRAGTNDGPNARAIFGDEFHEWMGTAGERLFHVLEGALTSRPDATMLMTTTAGYDEASVCYEKYMYGLKVQAGEIDDPRFYFRWLEAPSGCDYKDPQFWLIPNPLIGVSVHQSVLEDRILRDPESVFRRYHLNQWVAGEEIWIPAAVWDAGLAPDIDLDPLLPLHVMIDCGIRHDSSAVVAAQVQPENGRTVVRARIWQNPYARDHSLHDTWTLSIAQVEDYLRAMRAQFTAPAAEVDGEIQPGPEFCYDPAYFERSAQLLTGEGLTMVEYPQSDARMIPASQCLYDMLLEGKLAHADDESFRRQVLSAIADQKPRGWRLSKPKGSQRKIDAAIALAVAVYRAQQMAPIESPSVYEERGFIVF